MTSSGLFRDLTGGSAARRRAVLMSTPIEIAHFRRLKLHTGRAASPRVRSGLLPAGPAMAGGRGFGLRSGQAPDEVPVLAHAVAVPPDVDDVAVVEEAVDERGGHDVVTKHLAPVLETLVARQHGAGMLVAAGHELEKEHRSRPAEGQVANLVDDHEAGEDEGAEPVAQSPRLLRVLERRDEVGERGVVDAAAALGRGDGEAHGQVRLPDTRGPEEHHIFASLDEAQRVETLELVALDARLETEVEVGEGLHGREARGPHGRLQPPLIAERDVAPEELGHGFAGGELTAVGPA